MRVLTVANPGYDGRRTSLRRTRARRSALAGAAALAVTIGAGAWAGNAIRPEPRSQPDAARTVRAGAATLRVPGDWKPVPVAGGQLPGTTVAMSPPTGAHDRLVAVFAPATDASLVPSALRDLTAGLRGGPGAARLGGHPAWAYERVPGRDPDEVIDVTVLPTAAGVLGVACVSARSGPDARAMRGCASSIRSVSVDGAPFVLPTPDLAFRLRLPGVLDTLDSQRVRSRAELSRATTAAEQARAAQALAREHSAARESLRPLAGSAELPLLSRLSATADAYRRLAVAATAGSASGFDAARADVAAADAGVTAALERLAAGDRPLAPVPAARATPASPALPLAALPLVPIALLEQYDERVT